MENIRIENTEILSQAHQMCAEGSSDDIPTAIEVEALLKSKGYSIYNFDVSYDSFQHVWRWKCDII